MSKLEDPEDLPSSDASGGHNQNYYVSATMSIRSQNPVFLVYLPIFTFFVVILFCLKLIVMGKRKIGFMRDPSISQTHSRLSQCIIRFVILNLSLTIVTKTSDIVFTSLGDDFGRSI